MNNFIKNSALALILSISSIATAQLPDGSVAPDFTTTDVNGNTHRLYDYLDEGYETGSNQFNKDDFLITNNLKNDSPEEVNQVIIVVRGRSLYSSE